MGARSGSKDDFGRCPIRTLPGLVSEWIGVVASEHTLLGPGDAAVTIRWDGRDIDAPVMNEVLVPDDATEIIGTFTGSYYDGEPALVRRSVGEGTVYYLGGCFSTEMATALLRETGQMTPYRDHIELPGNVELAVRSDGSTDYLFLLNYRPTPVEFNVRRPLTDLTGATHDVGIETLEPFGVRILTVLAD